MSTTSAATKVPMSLFTDRARKVVLLATSEARQYGHAYVGTYHLLAGLLREGSGLGGGALRLEGLRLEGLRQRVCAFVSPTADATVPPARAALLERILVRALDVARDRQDRCVGTEHLLLALLDEPACFAVAALTACGVCPQGLRDTLEGLWPAPSPPTALVPVAAPVTSAREHVGRLLAATAGLRRTLAARGADGAAAAHHADRVATELAYLVELVGAELPAADGDEFVARDLAARFVADLLAPVAGEPIVYAATATEAIAAFLTGLRRVAVAGLGEVTADDDLGPLREQAQRELGLLEAAALAEQACVLPETPDEE